MLPVEAGALRVMRFRACHAGRSKSAIHVMQGFDQFEQGFIGFL